MYKIKILHYEKQYLLEELIKVFLRPDQYRLLDAEEPADADTILINEQGSQDKNEINRQIYRALSRLTGTKPAWGILTGIRPVKLCGELFEKTGSGEEAVRVLREDYYLSGEKAALLLQLYLHQQEEAGKPPKNSAGVYIGIPFCPTRCVYCSFASNQVPDGEIARYLEALHQEIAYTGRRMKETGMTAESVYIGGGTPTTLTAGQLDQLIASVQKAFDLSALREFTVEAGRCV